ncbi:dimethyl sulfoxide reductase anchor subunit [Shigella boydii]|nr:dimethyl sulfoxide reductase anchor subunit [Shigella boydii]
MKRVGKRGEGKFERISWDEALDTIASSLKKTVEQYGNEAVYIQYSSGIVGGNMTRSSPSASAVKRLMNCYGGSLNQYGSYSTAQISCAMPYTYGSNDGNSTTDIENSKLVVMFGNNPAETRMSGGGITYLLEKAREKSNAKMIVIDPRYTDTAAGREDEWLPIRPGTDAALVAGIAWVLINENLVDQPFLDKYCVGYDEKTLPAEQALGKLWLLVSMALGVIFVWMMTCVYQIDTVPTWHNGYTTLAFFLTVLLSGPILAAAILRAARVTFNTTPFAIISVLALIACAGVIVLQGLSLASIHSSVQQASALVPDYASLQVWRVVLLCAGLGCWLCPLIRRREPHVAGLVLGLILILVGEMIGRVLFYGLHMTVGMAIAG